MTQHAEQTRTQSCLAMPNSELLNCYGDPHLVCGEHDGLDCFQTGNHTSMFTDVELPALQKMPRLASKEGSWKAHGFHPRFQKNFVVPVPAWFIHQVTECVMLTVLLTKSRMAAAQGHRCPVMHVLRQASRRMHSLIEADAGSVPCMLRHRGPLACLWQLCWQLAWQGAQTHVLGSSTDCYIDMLLCGRHISWQNCSCAIVVLSRTRTAQLCRIAGRTWTLAHS